MGDTGYILYILIQTIIFDIANNVDSTRYYGSIVAYQGVNIEPVRIHDRLTVQCTLSWKPHIFIILAFQGIEAWTTPNSILIVL